MSVFAYAAVAHYGLPVAVALALLVLLALSIRLVDYARAVVYRAAVDVLEIRARWQGQAMDQRRQVAALDISNQAERLQLDINSQAQRLQLAAGHKVTLEQARWLMEHQTDIEIEAAPGDRQPAWMQKG